MGFSREFFSRPKDPKMLLNKYNIFYAHTLCHVQNVAQNPKTWEKARTRKFRSMSGWVSHNKTSGFPGQTWGHGSGFGIFRVFAHSTYNPLTLSSWPQENVHFIPAEYQMTAFLMYLLYSRVHFMYETWLAMNFLLKFLTLCFIWQVSKAVVWGMAFKMVTR